MVEIEMLESAVVSSYGRLQKGDILRCNDDYAAHLVNERKIAKYVTNEKPAKNSSRNRAD
jgi:hypothetical protein